MRALLVLPVTMVAATAVACGSGSVYSPPPARPAGMTLSSPTIKDNRPVPTQYTCDGAGLSPPLQWTAPPGAAALALVVQDPTAPNGGFTHWMVVDIDRSSTGVAENQAPPGGHAALNSAGKPGWTPICPPAGQRHRYSITLYALRHATKLPTGVPLSQAQQAIQRESMGFAQLDSVYQR